MAENIGKVIQVSGPAVDVQFEEATMPPIYQALRVTERRLHSSHAHQRHPRGAAAPGRGPRAHRGHGSHRRHGPRHEGHRSRRAHPHARGQADAGPRDQRHRRAGGRAGPHRRNAAHAHSPPRAAVRRAVHARGDVRDRHQGHRSHPALPEGRQDRPLRRRRRGQDRRHHGTDQQRGQEPRRLLRVWRRGRAHPRGQRPVA